MRQTAPISEHHRSKRRFVLDEQISRWLERFLTVLAFAWTVVVIAELALSVSPDVRADLFDLDVAIWLTFAFVFFVRLALADDKPRYLRNHLLEVMSVLLPFVRVAQVARIAVLFRPSWLLQILIVGQRSVREAGELFKRERLAYVLALLTISTLLGAAGAYFFERDAAGTPFTNFGDALWWAAALSTTINTSADPVTLEGRIIGLLLRIVALASFGFVTASIASFLITERTPEQRRLEQLLPVDGGRQAHRGRNEMSILLMLLGIVGSLTVVVGVYYAVLAAFKRQPRRSRPTR